ADGAFDKNISVVDVVSGLLEDDDVSSVNVPVRQQTRQRPPSRPVDELVHEEVIADQDRLFHRPGRDLISLDDKRADEEDEDGGNEQGFIPLPGGGVGSRFFRDVRSRRKGFAHSTFKTARKASCGMSTRPTRFIRFFPSFCFSKSLRFRVMSPP